MRALLGVILIGSFLGSCTFTGTQMSDEERATCEAQGGLVGANSRRDEVCSLPFEDAGQTCSSGTQCQGTCRVVTGTTRGQCMAQPVQSSCGLNYLDDAGIFQQSVCI